MKYFLIILFLFVGKIGVSQENVTSFKADGVNLVWDRVFKDDIDASTLFSYLESTGYFSSINKTDSTFSANFNKVNCDYKSAGLTRLSLPIMYADAIYSGGVMVQVKNGRYKVVLRNIIMTMQATNFETTIDLVEPLNNVVKNGQIKKSFLKKPALVLEVTFRNIFTVAKSDDNW